jgi:hypothetical protein
LRRIIIAGPRERWKRHPLEISGFPSDPEVSKDKADSATAFAKTLF